MKREECDVGSRGMVYDREGTQEWNEYFEISKGTLYIKIEGRGAPR